MAPAARREWLETFIELYKSEPCLWKTKSTEYYDRIKKDAAYEKLVKKLQEIEPTATRESVIRKINNIRCTYKKEYNKVVASMANSNDAVYEPRLWYYSLLSFLDNQDTSEIKQKISDVNSGSGTDTEQKVKEMDWNLKYLALNSGRESTDTLLSHNVSEDSFAWPPNCAPGLSDSQSVQFVQHMQPAKEERSDIVGKLVALKLRDLNKDQALLAEKIINETLFEAEMGRLTTGHRVQSECRTPAYCTLCNSVLLDLPVPVLEYGNINSEFTFDNT